MSGSGPFVFGRDSNLSGWLHRPDVETGKPAVVICNPVGFELVRAFRSLRVLADKLAASGHLVLRFDYLTTGDSAGDETDAGRVDAWLNSTVEALNLASELQGDSRVAVLGLRLGATLAAKAAESVAVDQLVLWAPCDSGAVYVREQQIMAAAQAKKYKDTGEEPEAVEGVDAGGFLLTPATQADLSAMTLGSVPLPGNPDVLLVNRDDIRVPARFAESIEARGSHVTNATPPGFKDMMLAPQLATVPGDAIDQIVAWFDERTAARDTEDRQVSRNEAFIAATLDAGPKVEEQQLRFGPDDRLFGIVSKPKSEPDVARPAMILLCGGATHRISANRMYVALARRLANQGMTVMRLDLAGIGDSLPHDGYPANKPYTDRLTQDIEAAMDAIAALTGAKHFTLFGLCSGAYAAMQTALQSERVAGLILANQLVYHLSARDSQRLASGQIASAHTLDFPRSSSLVFRSAVRILRRLNPVWGKPGEWLSRWLVGTNVRQQFELLVDRGVNLAFLLSSRDPAGDALRIATGKRLDHWCDSGIAAVKVFNGTDHTFSPTASQRELVDWVAHHADRDTRA